MTPKKKRKRFPKPVDFVAILIFGPDHRWAGRSRCTAWNPNQGKQCGRLPLKTSRTQKCRYHGGATPKGVASVHFKHGRYARIPTGLVGNFEDALNDTALLSLANEVALIESMMADVLGRWADEVGGGGLKAWKDTAEALAFTLEALNDSDAQGVADGIATMKTLVDSSLRSEDHRAAWLELADKKRELVLAESRRMREMSETMTRGMVVLYFTRMIEEIKNRRGRLIDGGLLIELADAFERILSGFNQRRVISSGGRDQADSDLNP